MLVTDASWAECHPMRRAVARPYLPWRCVAWTDETPTFLAIASRSRVEEPHLPDGWLIDGPDALLEAAAAWTPESYSVYVLGRGASGGDTLPCRVTGIWRELEASDGARGALWYSTGAGDMKPCEFAGAAGRIPPELINEISFSGSGIDSDMGR
jgi:hypothetical protein